MPHRPTNVPAPPFEQYEIPVTIPATGSRPDLDAADPVHHRVAARSAASGADPHTLRELPPDPEPHVPDGNNVILFLHGHVSGAEEALTIIPLLHLAGLARGTKFSIVSVDLPNCGYSESFDHEQVATSSATQWPSGPIDREPIRTPVLDFIEDFVIAFVDALDQITPIKDRFSGVIGGSLGGNLGLRLGRRSPMPAWLDKGIVSWNAASVWDPMVNDQIKSQAPGKCMNSWQASEFDDSRQGLLPRGLRHGRDSDRAPAHAAGPVVSAGVAAVQASAHRRLASRAPRGLQREPPEVALARRGRAARLQPRRQGGSLGHHEHVALQAQRREPPADRKRTGQFPRGRTSSTPPEKLADLMTTTPGTGLFLLEHRSLRPLRAPPVPGQADRRLPSVGGDAETGADRGAEPRDHRRSTGRSSIFRRRPRYGRILAVSGTNHTKNEPFSLTVAECVDFIEFGCEVFVARADGGRTAVCTR